MILVLILLLILVLILAMQNEQTFTCSLCGPSTSTLAAEGSGWVPMSPRFTERVSSILGDARPTWRVLYSCWSHSNDLCIRCSKDERSSSAVKIESNSEVWGEWGATYGGNGYIYEKTCCGAVGGGVVVGWSAPLGLFGLLAHSTHRVQQRRSARARRAQGGGGGRGRGRAGAGAAGEILVSGGDGERVVSRCACKKGAALEHPGAARTPRSRCARREACSPRQHCSLAIAFSWSMNVKLS